MLGSVSIRSIYCYLFLVATISFASSEVLGTPLLQLPRPASPAALVTTNDSTSPTPTPPPNVKWKQKVSESKLTREAEKKGDKAVLELYEGETFQLLETDETKDIVLVVREEDSTRLAVVEKKNLVALRGDAEVEVSFQRDGKPVKLGGESSIVVRVLTAYVEAPSENRCRDLDSLSTGNNRLTGPQEKEHVICKSRQVVPLPRMLSFREVRDNFGRRIANEYSVFQVVVRNASLDEQFILQDITVSFDPNVCSQLATRYGVKPDEAIEFNVGQLGLPPAEKSIKMASKLDIAKGMVGHCYNYYSHYLEFPIPFKSADKRTVLGVGTIGQTKSPRSILMNVLQFTASVGTSLSGLGLIGSDGKAGFGILGGSFLDSTRAALPDVSSAQLTNLTEAAYAGNNVIESRRSEPFFVFVPRDKIFNKESWEIYKKDRKGENENGLELRRIMELTLTAQASGMFVRPSNNKGVVSAPGNTFTDSLNRTP